MRHSCYIAFLTASPSRSYTYLQSGGSLPFSCFVWKSRQFQSFTAKYRLNKLKHRCCRPQMAVKVILTCLIRFHSLRKVFNLPCSRSLEKLCLALFFNLLILFLEPARAEIFHLFLEEIYKFNSFALHIWGHTNLHLYYFFLPGGPSDNDKKRLMFLRDLHFGFLPGTWSSHIITNPESTNKNTAD